MGTFLSKKILVISLGGTISMGAIANGGVVPSLSGEDLVARIQDISPYEISTHSLLQIPGAHITFDNIKTLARLIVQKREEGFDSFVITLGTDTIEDIAFALDILLPADITVCVTGAMRGPTSEGADGSANLTDALNVAAAPDSMGVTVVMNSEIHHPWFVRKSHTSNLSAFKSHPMGAIGWITENRSFFAVQRRNTPRLDESATQYDAKVWTITTSLDDDPEIVRAAIAANVDGLIFEAVGGGHTSPWLADALEFATSKMPVVLTSRIGCGHVLKSTYGFAGSEIDLIAKGLIPVQSLNGRKARIALKLMLDTQYTNSQIRAFFSDF